MAFMCMDLGYKTLSSKDQRIHYASHLCNKQFEFLSSQSCIRKLPLKSRLETDELMVFLQILNAPEESFQNPYFNYLFYFMKERFQHTQVGEIESAAEAIC